METLAERIIEAARQYALENPGASWESVADAMDAKLDAESGGLWNLWFLAAGFVVSFAAYFLIRESCVRAIELGMGLPAGAQAKLAERYTTDNEFKQAVEWKIG